MAHHIMDKCTAMFKKLIQSPDKSPGRNFQFSELTPCIHVVAQLYPWIKFCFPLFLGVVMYDNELETKENKI